MGSEWEYCEISLAGPDNLTIGDAVLIEHGPEGPRKKRGHAGELASQLYDQGWKLLKAEACGRSGHIWYFRRRRAYTCPQDLDA